VLQVIALLKKMASSYEEKYLIMGLATCTQKIFWIRHTSWDRDFKQTHLCQAEEKRYKMPD